MLNIGYAYKDRYGVIHVASDRRTAEEFARGKIIEYRLEHSGGYPVYDGRAVIIDTGDGVVKHAGIKYHDGKWPAGTRHIKSALEELLK